MIPYLSYPSTQSSFSAPCKCRVPFPVFTAAFERPSKETEYCKAFSTRRYQDYCSYDMMDIIRYKRYVIPMTSSRLCNKNTHEQVPMLDLKKQSINGDDMIGLHIIVHSINIPTIIIYQSPTFHHHRFSYNGHPRCEPNGFHISADHMGNLADDAAAAVPHIKLNFDSLAGNSADAPSDRMSWAIRR